MQEMDPPSSADLRPELPESKPYGSGYFGYWITDLFGLPAYRYTCNQITDPKAVSPVNEAWRSPTDHTHQVGNDRIIAAASNYGYVQVRQDEGSPKFLNDYCPERHSHGGGIGFLVDGETLLSTHFTAAQTFDRILGIGYMRKQVNSDRFKVDHVIFAPFGDDPVLISQVSITNRSQQRTNPRWVEYWGCHNYQFSYRSLMEASVLGDADSAPELRRKLSDRFEHQFQVIEGGRGLLDTQSFQGRAPEEEELWQKVQAALKANPNGFFGGPVPPLAPEASMDDLNPPPTFLVSLDAPADRFATDAENLFRGGISRPAGIMKPLNNDAGSTGPASAFLLERDLALDPGETQTLYFLYGYLPEGFDLKTLVTKYSSDPSSLWSSSSAHWKNNGVRFRTEGVAWVERETTWSSYYLRSGITYDQFFREHVLSQGAPYQYIAGLQGAARDPLQHALPFIFSDPAVVRQTIRYTLKEVQPDGSLPYGIVGSGVPMPCRYRPSDQQLWLLWLATEYVLATRHIDFLNERVPCYPKRNVSSDDPTVRDLLSRAYLHITRKMGSGPHGLMRILNGDWNDSVVVNRLEPAQVAEITERGESVLNAAMSAYVLDHYARMLNFIGDSLSAQDAHSNSEAQRQAVSRQWNGRWFRRAWLGESLGWSGDDQLWLEPQPWAIIGNCATQEQVPALITSIDHLVRQPSPIGALLQSQADRTMKNNPGVATNGGIFAAINGTLVWALALENGLMAWDEWKKNSFARHADAYPDFWFGIWSGPDTYTSILSKEPGSTSLEFPVMNMHVHAWPLYSAAKLLGLEFHEHGVSFKPLIPIDAYEFSSPLLGFSRTKDGVYSGWYAPAACGTWEVTVELPDSDVRRQRRVAVNGTAASVSSTHSKISFTGANQPSKPLQWQID